LTTPSQLPTTHEKLEEGNFEIGNIDLLLDLVASLDPDYVKAFAQFPLNSFDALSEKSIPNRTEIGRVEIRFELTRKVPQIVVCDFNSRGMTYDQLRAVPTKIGSSEKRQQWDELINAVKTNRRLPFGGYQAIGVYVYRRMCDYLMIVTRSSEPGSKTLAALLPTEHGAKWEIFEEPTEREVPGTDVYLVGVKPQMWQRKDIEKLKNYFRKAFRYRLRTADPPIELVVVEDGKRGASPVSHKIMPAKFEGEKLPDEQILTFWTDKSGGKHDDPTYLELYYHPGVSGGTIEVEFSQNYVAEDLCRIEGLNIAPFNSGELEGVVSPTFLLPDMQRGNFLRDSEGRFDSWQRQMQSFARDLGKRIESRSREARTGEMREFEKKLRVAFRNAARIFNIETLLRPDRNVDGTDEITYCPPKGKKTKKIITDSDQEILDRWKTWVWQLLDQGISNVDQIQKLIKNQHRITLDKNSINIFIRSYENRGKAHVPQGNQDQSEERKRRADLMANFQLIYQNMWSGDGISPPRSMWDDGLKAVKINTAHPEYKTASEDESKSGVVAYNRYLVEVTVKTLVPVYFESETDATVLFERFVDLRNMVWRELGLIK
jgi:hypothetical protein